MQEKTGQTVALKMLRPHVDQDEKRQQRQIERFQREIQLCAGLSHPHIVKLLDNGQTPDGQWYAVFEYIPGQTLKDVLVRRGPLPATEAGELMGQVLEALAYAHDHGIVHRDLKPHNIMVSSVEEQVQVKVLDFGVGALIPDQRQTDYHTLTMANEMIGTPAYSAPEQLRGEPPTTKSDLYAWGLVFLECLTGQLAIRGRTLAEIYYEQLKPADVVLPPAIAGHPLANLLRRTLRKELCDRAEHADQVYADLGQLNLADLVAEWDLGANTREQTDAMLSATLERDGLGHAAQQAHRESTFLDDFSQSLSAFRSPFCTGPALSRPLHHARMGLSACLDPVHLGCDSFSESVLDRHLAPKFDCDAASHPAAMEGLEALPLGELSLISDIASTSGGDVTGRFGDRVMIWLGDPCIKDTDAHRAAKAIFELIDQSGVPPPCIVGRSV